MGITIMPSVKARSFIMTELQCESALVRYQCQHVGTFVVRRHGRSDVGLLACCWAGANAVVFLEERLLLRDDTAGGHVDWISAWLHKKL